MGGGGGGGGSNEPENNPGYQNYYEHVKSNRCFHHAKFETTDIC